MRRLKRGLRAGIDRAESLFEAAFGAAWNPLTQLGALGWFFYWIVAASGIYLYVFFDTGVSKAYASVEALTYVQPYAGGIMRSLHRYASDALIVVVLVHMLREFAFDRLRGRRWFAWVTGIVLLAFTYACGITGYWLVWDRLAQYVAVTTAEFLDALPLFGDPIARNFVSDATLSDRFFTLMVFIHIAAPLLMLLLMWVHIQRHVHARVLPRRGLAIGTGVMLLGLALARPATSQGPADLDSVPLAVGLDWFYLTFYPWMDRAGLLWAGFALGGILLVLLPWLPPLRRRAALVDLDNCNGCGRCFADCPYSAITMGPRSDGAAYAEQAVVDPQLCTACGICAGACPTATPFRKASELLPGIELPDQRLAPLRERLLAAADRMADRPRIVVFRCEEGEAAELDAGTDTACLTLPCVGMLPPAFIDYAISRDLADGVMIAGCRAEDCYCRLGARWTEQRIAAERDPHLRERVPRERVAVSWAAPDQSALRLADLAAFRRQLAALGPWRRGERGSLKRAWRRLAERQTGALAWVGQAAGYLLLAATLGYLATSPALELLSTDQAQITLSFTHAGQPVRECRQLTGEELARLAPNMRQQLDCPRERVPILAEMELDGERIHQDLHPPTGLWSDGPSAVYERFAVPAGPHELVLRLRDSRRASGFDYEHREQVLLAPQQHLVIDFRGDRGDFVIR